MIDAYALLDHRAGERMLLDLAQAAPQYPPAPEVTDHVTELVRDARGAEYVELGGLGHLREVFAAELSRDYAGRVDAENIVVTAGCNQAFCLVSSALAEPGEEVILTLPYYFNHDMWLKLDGVQPVYLDPGPDLVPTVEAAERLVTSRTRAIVLVSPGNPSGLTLTPETIADFADLARRHGLALVLDETYRSFRGTEEPAHRLFADSDWSDVLVSLHSFSKDLAIPGYRVGAVVASPALNREIMKLLDCLAICAPRIGQEAAWAGLTRGRRWRSARAREVDEKRTRFAAAMGDRPGDFEMLSIGGYFAWLRHPYEDRGTDDVVRDLAVRLDTLVIPGTAFQPDDRRTIRVSYSNLGEGAIADFADRLALSRRALR